MFFLFERLFPRLQTQGLGFRAFWLLFGPGLSPSKTLQPFTYDSELHAQNHRLLWIVNVNLKSPKLKPYNLNLRPSVDLTPRASTLIRIRLDPSYNSD